MRWPLILALAGCHASPPPAAPVDRAHESQVVATLLDTWHDAAARADEEGYFGLMSSDSVFLGTDATERWSVRRVPRVRAPALRERQTAWAFTTTRCAVDVIIDGDGRFAWFDEDLASDHLGPLRGTAVLRKEDHGWRIVHYSLTLTIPNERVDAVRAAISGELDLPPTPASE